MKAGGINQFVGLLLREGQNDRANHCRGDKQRCQKQKPTTKENRRKKAIFTSTEPVTQYPDEPQEGNSGEWHHVECQRDGVDAGFEPRPRFERIRRCGNPKQSKRDYKEYRKSNPSTRGSLWCFQGCPCQLLFRHRCRLSLHLRILTRQVFSSAVMHVLLLQRSDAAVPAGCCPSRCQAGRPQQRGARAASAH